MLFSDIDPGPYRNGRRYLTPMKYYHQGRRPYCCEGRRCLCHVIVSLKEVVGSGRRGDGERWSARRRGGGRRWQSTGDGKEQRPTEKKKKGSSPPQRVMLVWYVLHIGRIRARFEERRRCRLKKKTCRSLHLNCSDDRRVHKWISFERRSRVEWPCT
ncbi:hypothetical protein EVAR_75361_1 [Eumeta japonica]|uniref:Uncharacterized protein n=1 Tax=Eumeta variegata TaxID=151549 RepID=A0A4C1YD23_EUMVA|nr:hypothetical protein EVAR_75361_1 [Eumeta japonica]